MTRNFSNSSPSFESSPLLTMSARESVSSSEYRIELMRCVRTKLLMISSFLDNLPTPGATPLPTVEPERKREMLHNGTRKTKEEKGKEKNGKRTKRKEKKEEKRKQKKERKKENKRKEKKNKNIMMKKDIQKEMIFEWNLP
mmetsp:Transcript_2715/g.4924  ORF Transcript_2715/g.4924 Transcript_2715/m.4924 type:complete len:141 (+) Transcript_2715:1461-1883(+)